MKRELSSPGQTSLGSVFRSSPARGQKTIKTILPADRTEQSFRSWLKRVGLSFDPFVPLDAGEDTRLSTYLIGSDIFEKVLWGDWHSFLFAPQGGGKTAFRVRLAYECRVGGENREVFAVPYHVPLASTIEEQAKVLGRAAAAELLLEIAYRPQRFEDLLDDVKADVKSVLEWNAPGLLDQFLPQLNATGSPLPLIESFDRSATHLPNLPDSRRVLALVEALTTLHSAPPPPRLNAVQGLNRLLKLIRNDLKFEAVYILLDGIDSYPETTHDLRAMMRVLRPILKLMHTLEQRSVFLKAFLPEQLSRSNTIARPGKLTRGVKSATILWNSEQLIDLLRVRVRAASHGEFDSLDAISDPGLRGIEELLVEEAQPLPREVLALAHHLLTEHCRQPRIKRYLEQADLGRALHQYDPKAYPLTTALP